ncbi:hypothetical protein B0T18DRAFT_249255 [Schizothecium vesticola]|uniref:Uncharacterized protein n=1 Tax=Schizothecium vesticola TaxID=314040 RepID=A0AA40BQN0_9PEZI|nr:hypothetical protein B0T18DRAFT_249255 [Schizothecium vesticola]
MLCVRRRRRMKSKLKLMMVVVKKKGTSQPAIPIVFIPILLPRHRASSPPPRRQHQATMPVPSSTPHTTRLPIHCPPPSPNPPSRPAGPHRASPWLPTALRPPSRGSMQPPTVLMLNNTGLVRHGRERIRRPARWSTGLLSARSIGRWYSVSISLSAVNDGEEEKTLAGQVVCPTRCRGTQPGAPCLGRGDGPRGTLPKPIPRRAHIS